MNVMLVIATIVVVLSCTVSENSGAGADDFPVDLCGSSNVTKYSNYTTTKLQNCGCANELKCVRRCCQSGFYHYHYEDYHKGEYESICIKHGITFTVPIYEETVKKFDSLGGFLVGMLDCRNEDWQYFQLNISVMNEQFYVQENGLLYYPHSDYKFYNNSRYCVDEDGSVAYVCYTLEAGKEVGRVVVSTGMIISMPFLLATFIVYAILPESNLHRKALMNYVMTLLLAYIFLVTVQLYPEKFAPFECISLGYMIIFFFLVSFFWMNVMCLDMWFAFSGMRGFNGRGVSERRRFLMYFGYAFGVPILHILVVFLIDKYSDVDSIYHPGIGDEKCFLKDNMPNLLYFYGPMAILITINIILFILTAVKIQKVKKETSVLKHSDSKRHSYEDDKQKFNLYLKLLFAMGINWTMEIVSWAIQWKMGPSVPLYVWYLTDFCNAMYGVLIFFIFVFKRKIWRSLKKRYYVLRGKPIFAHSMSTTQTTRTSNYSTTDTGHNDHRLSELKNTRGEERMLPRN